MSSILLLGDTSGSVTLAAPAIAGSNTVTLPTTGGTIRTTTTSGTILQVVNTVLTSATSVNTSGGFAEITGLATSITPSSASNKILVFLTLSGGNANGYRTGIKLVRNSTDIFIGDAAGSRTRSTLFAKNLDSANQASYDFSFSGLDSPATTSATTYKLQIRLGQTSYSAVTKFPFNAGFGTSYTATIILQEIKV